MRLHELFLAYGLKDEIIDKKYKILIIDDDLLMREALIEVFSTRPYDLIVCKDGDEAIDIVDDSLKAVILDIKMPRINGYELYQNIKQKSPNLPIIFHSADAGKDAQKCLTLKPFSYVHKGTPGSYEKMTSAIEGAIGDVEY